MGSPGYQLATQFTELTDLDPVLTTIYYQHLGELDQLLDSMFNVLSSSKRQETDLRIGSFSDPPEFVGQIEYDSADPDYTITYTPTEYAKGFKVERKLLDDQQYQPIFASAQDMARAFRRKVEKDAASVFNNAFSGSFLGYDSKALCADDHPRSESDSTSVDNNATLALTADNLETVRQQANALVDDKGELFSGNWDLLIVPDELRRTAHEITMSELDPDSAENANNMFTNMRYIAWNRLTDANAWFLVDSEAMNRYLKWYWRVRPEFGAVEDFDTFLRKYRGYMRYSYGWSEFRWIVGSNPS